MSVYEYTTFRIERGGWPRLPDEIREIDAASRELGGSVYLVCAGLIGFASDEGILVRHWPDHVEIDGDSGTTIAATGVVREWKSERLSATVRPTHEEAPREPGVYAHRWFWLNPEHWNEFLQLSERGIWPYFESDGCAIIGLWRGADEGSLRSALLITRYPSVAHWERTRLQSVDAPPGADAELYRRAQEAGRKRAAVTERSIVRLTRIVPPPGDAG